MNIAKRRSNKIEWTNGIYVIKWERVNGMYEYFPWSKGELSRCIKEYVEGRFTILDIELGGICNFNCMYCDSPDRHKKFSVDFNKIEEIIKTEKIRWIYICGLGEPAFGANKTILIQLLELAEKAGVRCSIFTNLSNITDELIDFVDKGVLYLLFKLDSFEKSIAAKMYGTEKIDYQLTKIQDIAEHVFIKNGCTNLAASIVPTKMNKMEVPEIVSWCLEKKIYPLVAELENAGSGISNYEQLYLNKEELADIRMQILIRSNEEFKVPLCPAMIGGIHINHEGMITIDKATGYSCHWFWLRNPVVKQIASLKDGCWEEYSKEIKDYRMALSDKVKEYLNNCKNETYVFGGCGGSIEELFLNHLVLHHNKVNEGN